MKVQSHELAVCRRNRPYKYLGKSLSISGEDPKQVDQILENYKRVAAVASWPGGHGGHGPPTKMF